MARETGKYGYCRECRYNYDHYICQHCYRGTHFDRKETEEQQPTND